MARVSVRDDLRALEGYHSPQVDVRVRLNTNEAPVGPPAEFRRDLAAAIDSIAWNRYPDRAATALRAAIADLHGVPASMVFVANGSNEVLQTILLTFAGPGRKVATFEPTYQLHAHIARITGATVVEGERAADFSLDPNEVKRIMTTERPDVGVPVLAQQSDRWRRRRRAGREGDRLGARSRGDRRGLRTVLVVVGGRSRS